MWAKINKINPNHFKMVPRFVHKTASAKDDLMYTPCFACLEASFGLNLTILTLTWAVSAFILVALGCFDALLSWPGVSVSRLKTTARGMGNDGSWWRRPSCSHSCELSFSTSAKSSRIPVFLRENKVFLREQEFATPATRRFLRREK